MPTAAYLSPELQKIAGRTLRPGGLALTDRAMEICRFAPGSRLLDIGCGLGTTLRHLRDVHAMDVAGVDLSFQMLQDAQGATRLSSQAVNFNLVMADGMAVPFMDESLDGILCECVLSLMPNPLQGIAECYRILRTAGQLVISDLYSRRPLDGNFTTPFRTSGCLAGIQEKAALVRMVREAGFTILTWEDHTHYLTQLAADMIFSKGTLDWFYNLMGNGAEIREAACKSKPGYHLMIAVKGNTIHG